MYNNNRPRSSYNLVEQEQRQYDEQRVATYLAKVMGWMCVGLLTTLASALICLAVPGIFNMLYGTNAMFLIFVAQFGLVIVFSARMHKTSPGGATAMFMVYSALTGLTMSSLFLLFQTFSLIAVFGLTAFIFVSMAIYGLVTKRDLTRIGSLAFFGLLGIIVAGIVNIFLGSSMLDFGITVIGIVLFIVLTAYDTQKIKAIYLDTVARGYDEDGPELRKIAIFGALTLYLDFINLFLKLLRLLGNRRD